MSHTRPLAFALLLSSFAFAHEREGQAVPIHPADSPDLTTSLSAGWDSRYFVEGRDVLDGDSIFTQSLEMQWQSLGFGVWYGDSPEQRYNELQLAASYLHSFGPVDTYLSYTHLRFPDDSAHDHDLGTGLAWKDGPYGLEFALDAYYSTRNEGWFGEFSITREWELSEALTLDAGTIFGVNQGYVADGHDGANHLALTTGLSYALTESLSLSAHATYSWGIDRKAGAADDAVLDDFFHGGVGLEWSF